MSKPMPFTSLIVTPSTIQWWPAFVDTAPFCGGGNGFENFSKVRFFR